MALSNQPQKGMLDEFPWELSTLRRVEGPIKRLLESHHYEEYDAPVLEPLELFAAKSSDELVREQTYVLKDRGDRELVLRPEMTPTLARMVSQIYRERPRPYRWYSVPKCYRYERPQKGRLREFRQLNVDLMGDDSVHSDLEMLELVTGVMGAFAVPAGTWSIRWNHRGALGALLASRGFDEAGVKAFTHLIDRVDKLSPEAFQEMAAQKIPDAAQRDFLTAYLKRDKPEELLEDLAKVPGQEALVERLKTMLDLCRSCGLDRVTYSPRTVRGLDYYTGLVFEVYAEGESINRALFGGGRYDNLLGLFGGEPMSGIGFGMGFYIFSIFLEESGLLPKAEAPATGVTLVQALGGIESQILARKVAAGLRAGGGVAEISFASGGLKKLFQRAESRGFTHVAILGDDEVRDRVYTLKDMKTGEQKKVPLP